jgi:predicted MPP superfamily phosphohydrolase
MWLFGSGLFLIAYLGINIYTGIRFFSFIKFFLPSFKAFIFWPIYFLFCYSFILFSVLQFAWTRPFRLAGMSSIPVVFYFFLALLLLDGLRISLQHFGYIPHTQIYSAAGTGIAICLALITMIYGASNARSIRTVHYTVTLNKRIEMPHLRIALVSDLHIGETVGRKWVANIVDAINKIEPDIICIAGDIIDSSLEGISDLEAVAGELKRLNAPLGVYACQGNHDVDRLSLRQTGGTGSGMEGIKAFLETADIVFLLDEIVMPSNNIYIAGRKDARPIGLRQERKPAAELAVGLDTSKALIVLDHQPVDYSNLEKVGADLILSGHTHRGQFFPGNLATRLIFKKAGATHYGYWRGSIAQAVVSSGAGVWGPPLRVATGSEVVVIDVVFREGGISTLY